MSGSTFLVLDKGKELPATDVSALLGRFVTDPAEPSFQFTPQRANPGSLLGEGATIVVRDAGKQSDCAETHSRFTTSLQRILSLGLVRQQIHQFGIGNDATVTRHSL